MIDTKESIQLKAVTYPVMDRLMKATENLYAINADENDSERTALKLLDWIKVLDEAHKYAHLVVHGFVSQFGYSVIEGIVSKNNYCYSEAGKIKGEEE